MKSVKTRRAIKVVGEMPAVRCDPDKPEDMNQIGNGTFQVKFFPVCSSFFRKDGDNEGVLETQMQCITAIDCYKNYSLEELRWDDYKIRAFKAMQSPATKELQLLLKSVQNSPVIDLSGPCQSSSDTEFPVLITTSRRDSWPSSANRAVPSLGCTSPIPTRRSLPPTGSGNKSSPFHSSDSPSPSVASILNTPVDFNGLVQTSQSILKSLSPANCPVKSSPTEPTITPFTDGLCLASDDNTKQPDSCGQPTSDPSQNRPVHNSGDSLNSSQVLFSPSPLIQNFTEATNGRCSTPSELDLPTRELLLRSPSKAGSDQPPKSQSRDLELGALGNSVCVSSRLPGAHPGDQSEGRESWRDREGQETTICHFLGRGVSRLTDLQRSIGDLLLCQDAAGELLGRHIVFELRSSQDFKFYERMPCDLLCLAVASRDSMTEQLMDLYRQSSTNDLQMNHVILETLSKEFRFIGQLKMLMLKKLLEVRHSNDEPSSPTSNPPTPNFVESGAPPKTASRLSTEEEEPDDEIHDRVMDARFQSLLNDKEDMLVFSEPGKLFRFAVQPGSRYAENWTEKSDGMVSVYENAAAKQAKIVVCDWTAKRSRSVILVKSSMKAWFSFSSDGHAVKLMGLDVFEGGRNSMKYFQMRFKDRDGAAKFRDVLESMSFLNISRDVQVDSVCCLDVKFKSVAIHDEFPSVKKSEETPDGAATSADHPPFDGISKVHHGSTLRARGDDGKRECGEVDAYDGDYDLRCSRNKDDIAPSSELTSSVRKENAFACSLCSMTTGCHDNRSVNYRHDDKAVLDSGREDGSKSDDDEISRHISDLSEHHHDNVVKFHHDNGRHDDDEIACCINDLWKQHHDNIVKFHHDNGRHDDDEIACRINDLWKQHHDNIVKFHHGNGHHDDEITRHVNDLSEQHHDNVVKFHHGNGRRDDDEIAHRRDDLSEQHHDSVVEYHHGNGDRGDRLVGSCNYAESSNDICDADECENESVGTIDVDTKNGACKTEVDDGAKEEVKFVGGKEIEDCAEDEDNVGGRSKEIKGVIVEADAEVRSEEIRGVIEADAEVRSEEIRGVIEADAEVRSKEIKDVIEADEEVRSEEIKGVIEADEEIRSEEIKGVIESDEVRSKEIKGVIEADEEVRSEEIRGVIEADEEIRSEEIRGVIEADEEVRSEEIRGVIEADEEVIKGVSLTAREEKCEEMTGGEEKFEEIKDVLETDVGCLCEENRDVSERNGEDVICEESRSVLLTTEEPAEILKSSFLDSFGVDEMQARPTGGNGFTENDGQSDVDKNTLKGICSWLEI